MFSKTSMEQYVFGEDGLGRILAEDSVVLVIGGGLIAGEIVELLDQSSLPEFYTQVTGREFSAGKQVNGFNQGDLEKILAENKVEVVLYTESDKEEAVRVNAICRKLGSKFIWTSFEFVFVDFGANFETLNVDDRVPLKLLVQNIEFFEESPKSSKVIITVDDSQPHGFKNNDLVQIEPLNTLLPVTVITDFSFEVIVDQPVPDLSKLKFDSIVSQIKPGKTFEFSPLSNPPKITESGSKVLRKCLATLSAGVGVMQTLICISKKFQPIFDADQYLKFDLNLSGIEKIEGVDEEFSLQKICLVGKGGDSLKRIFSVNQEINDDATIYVAINASETDVESLDAKSVEHARPLVIGSVNGARGMVQCVVPHVTNNYAGLQHVNKLSTARNRNFQICSVENFPYLYEHTLEFAKNLFISSFVNNLEATSEFLSIGKAEFVKKLDKQPNTKDTLIAAVVGCLKLGENLSAAACVHSARLLFKEILHDRILQLLYNFPPNMVSSNNVAFWHGSKRLPSAQVFDIKNSMHLEFIKETALLYAKAFNLQATEIAKLKDASFIASEIDSVMVEEFKPLTDLKIAADDSELQDLQTTDNTPKESEDSLPDTPQMNHQITPQTPAAATSFIHLLASLRAESYKITPFTISESNRYVNGIVPLITPMSHIVAGLAGVEMFKIVAGQQDLETFKNWFMNFSLPLLTGTDPLPVQKYMLPSKREWSVWDKFEFVGPMNLGELVNKVESQFQVEVEMVSFGNIILESAFMNKKKKDTRRKQEVKSLVESIRNETLGKTIQLEVLGVDNEGEDVENLPSVMYRLQ